MKDLGEKHIIKVVKNGTYYVELTDEDQKLITQFSVCHLKPLGSFAGGDGSAQSPYLISNCAQLIGIRSDLQAHYRLIEDLDFEKEMKNLCWLGSITFPTDEMAELFVEKIDDPNVKTNKAGGGKVEFEWAGEKN